MKILIALFMGFSSLSVLACPNLNGSFYKCTTGDRIQDVAMGINKAKLDIQQVDNNISVDFLGKKTTFKIDETVTMQNYSQQQRATIYSSVYSSCQNAILTIEEESKLVYDNGKIELENSDTNVYIKADKIYMDIVQHQSDGRDLTLNIQCKKR